MMCFVFLLMMTGISGCSFSEADTSPRAPAPPTDITEDINKEPTVMDTYRAMAPPEGLNFTPLFSAQIDDGDARFRRLEDAVQRMRNDFDTVMPSIVRLVSIEKDIKDLVTQLETLTSGEAVSVPVTAVDRTAIDGPLTFDKFNKIPRGDIAGGTDTAAAPQAVADASGDDTSRVTPEAASEGQLPPEDAASHLSADEMDASADDEVEARSTAPVQIAPQANKTPVEPPLGDIRAVRIGDHMDKTRIVLDMTARISAAPVLEQGGKRIVIDLPRMDFTAAKSWASSTSALVSSYSFSNGKLTIDLLYPVEIRQTQTLPPVSGNPNFRLLIDLFSSDVHQ